MIIIVLYRCVLSRVKERDGYGSERGASRDGRRTRSGYPVQGIYCKLCCDMPLLCDLSFYIISLPEKCYDFALAIYNWKFYDNKNVRAQ